MAKTQAAGRYLLELAELLRGRRVEVSPNALEIDRIPKDLSVPTTTEIREHKAFKWLQEDTDFQRAKKLFEDGIKQANGMPWGYGLGGYADFTELMALFAGSHMRNLEWKPTGASAVLRQKAIDTAETLLELMSQGATLSNLIEAESLKRSLETLICELPNTRKPYTGKNSAQRVVLRGFASSLLRRRLSPRQAVEVVAAIAPLFGFAPKLRDVQRFVKYAAEVTLR